MDLLSLKDFIPWNAIRSWNSPCRIKALIANPCRYLQQKNNRCVSRCVPGCNSPVVSPVCARHAHMGSSWLNCYGFHQRARALVVSPERVIPSFGGATPGGPHRGGHNGKSEKWWVYAW